jgi:hypothetical protein
MRYNTIVNSHFVIFLVKSISLILLLFNGLGAFYGGFLLITDPSGSTLQIPLSFLEHSPFRNYLIPGIVLIVVNGFFSFITFVTIVRKMAGYYWFIIAQGVLLCGWIIIQVLFLQQFYVPLHATFLVIGVVLIGSGYYLKLQQ